MATTISRNPPAKRKRKAAPAISSSAAQVPRVTIRHYCQGIGDCHLLTFYREGGGAFRMLIDCGLHNVVKGGTAIIDKIASDIKSAIQGNPIDVLVVTHEHWDHISGFWTAKEIFETITFGEVWMGWTEKPGDPLAEELDTYRGQALAALSMASRKLADYPALSPHLEGVRTGLDKILGFHFGAEGDAVRKARNVAADAAAPKQPTYLEPGSPPISIAGLPNLRIFVLGPPRDKALLRLEERKSEMYQFGGRTGWALERALSAGFALGKGDAEDWAVETAPFQDDHGYDLNDVLSGKGDAAILGFVADHYSGNAPKPASTAPERHLADQDWRRIDADWLGIAADLALQLDQGINNTSLVLAFEFIDTGRVVLFPGDAQIGSWLSWQPLKWADVNVAATDLLARTVYLKVSHHGSHNATPHRHGLEQMVSPDLSAFIPVNETDAKKATWKEMPFGTILTTLDNKTAGRVIRADEPWIGQATGRPAFSTPSGSIMALRNEGKGWVEVDIA